VLRGVAGDDHRDDLLELRRLQAGPVLELGERAVVAEHGRLAHLQVDVAGARFGRIREQRVEIHGVIIGTPELLL
jgi:hypothetical protein